MNDVSPRSPGFPREAKLPKNKGWELSSTLTGKEGACCGSLSLNPRILWTWGLGQVSGAKHLKRNEITIKRSDNNVHSLAHLLFRPPLFLIHSFPKLWLMPINCQSHSSLGHFSSWKQSPLPRPREPSILSREVLNKQRQKKTRWFCFIFLNSHQRPWLVWLSDWVPICKSRGHRFNSQSGHMPGLRARSWVGVTLEATTH